MDCSILTVRCVSPRGVVAANSGYLAEQGRSLTDSPIADPGDVRMLVAGAAIGPASVEKLP